MAKDVNKEPVHIHPMDEECIPIHMRIAMGLDYPEDEKFGVGPLDKVDTQDATKSKRRRK